MLYSGPARLRHLDPLLSLIEIAAVELARELRRHAVPRRPARRNATLRPGVETPHWLALVEMVRPLLRRRGAKALLAYELGLHRGRITQFFTRRSAMPDAERTLLLLFWLARQDRKRRSKIA